MTENNVCNDSSALKDRKALVTSVQKGEFLKPCPGTAKSYLCCGYQILTPLTGCGMYCSYCVLQSYFDHRCQVVYENFGDLEKEVGRKLSSWRGIMRIGTGEFADSLYQEGSLGLCKKIADILDPYPQVVVEFKTKCGSINGLDKIKNPHKVVIGLSMNTRAMIAAYERDTAPLEARLSMIAACEKMGFFIGIHFDPIFHYDKWEIEYLDVVKRIFAHIKDPRKIAWWSMGGFRTNPALKRVLKREGAHLPLFSRENIIFGEDGKYRYFRPIRVAFYKAFQEEIKRHAPKTVLYLCMENEDVWNDAGMLDRIPRGLPAYLDMRAIQMGAKDTAPGIGRALSND